MTAEIWDVIVVGAGLSGLSAAHLLRKRDPSLRIVVVEGKGRVGGRTVTTEIPAASGVDCWDFGGQWVASTQTYILELIKELGLETFPQFNTGKKVYHMGGPNAKVRTYRTSIPALSPLVLMDLTQFIWKIDRLCATVCVQDPSKTPSAMDLDSMTLHSYTEQHAWTAELKEEIGLCSRSVFGMEPSQMSFLFFLMYAAAAGGMLPLLESTPGSAQELKIKGGTQQLSECLAERVGWKNVRLGSAVTAIWQDAEWARVMTATDTLLCRAVIVTCPPHLAGQALRLRSCLNWIWNQSNSPKLSQGANVVFIVIGSGKLKVVNASLLTSLQSSYQGGEKIWISAEKCFLWLFTRPRKF